MPKTVFDQLNYTTLAPTQMRLQLADSSVRRPEGIAEDIPVKIRGCFVPVDFVVLDMLTDKDMPFILGRPFLSTADARINVAAGEIRLHINGKEEKFAFKPKPEQCSMVKIKFGENDERLEQVEVTPPQPDPLIVFMKKFWKREEELLAEEWKAAKAFRRQKAKEQRQRAQRARSAASTTATTGAPKAPPKPAPKASPKPAPKAVPKKTKQVWRVKTPESSVSSSPGPDDQIKR